MPVQDALYFQAEPNGLVLMRLAVFSHYYHPEIGAPSARIGDLAARWIEAGHEPHVITCFPNHPTGVVYPGYRLQRYAVEELDGVHVHRNWTFVTRNTGMLKRTFGHLTFWLSAGWNTRARLPQMDCAIGTSPTLFAAMAARACARRQRIPFIMEVRDLWPAIFRELGVIRNSAVLAMLERWEMGLYRSADRVVTVTEAFRKNLISRGVAADKVVTITNGADTDFWNLGHARPGPLRKRLGLDGKFVALYIGAHGISQALSAHLRAAARLAGDDRIRFVFVGEGAEKNHLTVEARRLGLRNVLFLDPVGRDEVRDFYALADLCFVPLRKITVFDTFIPSKMFEIMSMSRPVLASLRGEAGEILARSGGAHIVGPEDDEAIAASVAALSLNPAGLARMGSSAREFVVNHYDRRRLAERYLDVVQCARRSREKEARG